MIDWTLGQGKRPETGLSFQSLRKLQQIEECERMKWIGPKIHSRPDIGYRENIPGTCTREWRKLTS